MSGDLLRSLSDQGQDTPSSALSFAYAGNEDPAKQKLAEKVMRDMASAGTGVNTFNNNGSEDSRYYHGHQWPDLDRMRMEQLRRPALVFDEIGGKIDAISGLERLNRQDVHAVSRAIDSDIIHDAAGDLASESVACVLDTCNGELETSRVVKDCAIVGMGWGEISVSYEDDPDGRVIFMRLPYKEMYWDTKAIQENIEDSKWRARKRDFSRSDFKKRFPGMIDKVDGAAIYYEEMDVSKYELVTPYYSRANEEANPQVGQQTERTNSIPVIQYQYRDMVPIWRIADPQDPQKLQTLTEEQWDSLKKRNELAGQPMPKAVRQLKPVYKQVYVALGVVLEDEVVLPSGWSLLCLTGQYDEVKKCWYGIVRRLKDPQNTINKAISSLVTQYITNAKGGVFFKTGTFADVNMAKDQYAKPDSWIEVNPDANLQTDIQQRQPANISQVPPMLFQQAQAQLSRTSGVSDEMQGISTTDATGPTIGARVQGGLIILGWFWDNISRYRKQQFRTILEFVREYWSYGQLVRVGGEFNSKAIPLLKSELPAQDQYDMILDDSVRHNPNLKQQIWSEVLQIAPQFVKSPFGQQFLIKALKFSPWPAQLVAEFQELAQQSQQQPQKPQRGGKQEDPQMTQAKIQKLSADTQRSLAEAKAIDRKSNLDIAQLTSDTLLKSQELQHKKSLEHAKLLHDRIATAKQQMQSIQPQPVGDIGA